MFLNARRAATVFLTAAFGVPVCAADGVIGTWMSGTAPSEETYMFKTHDNLLPLSGLFVSVMYPTINSKGISGVSKGDHGAAAGVILFFTCVAAVVAPLMLGGAGDAFGDLIHGYWLASGFAVLRFCGSILNWALNPTRAVLEERDMTSTKR